MAVRTLLLAEAEVQSLIDWRTSNTSRQWSQLLAGSRAWYSYVGIAPNPLSHGAAAAVMGRHRIHYTVVGASAGLPWERVIICRAIAAVWLAALAVPSDWTTASSSARMAA